MRPVLVCDVLGLARCLLGRPRQDWRALADALIAEADAADQYRARLRRQHPEWGDGSVLSRCLLAKISAEPNANSPDHLDAIAFSARQLRQKLLPLGS